MIPPLIADDKDSFIVGSPSRKGIPQKGMLLENKFFTGVVKGSFVARYFILDEILVGLSLLLRYWPCYVIGSERQLAFELFFLSL